MSITSLGFLLLGACGGPRTSSAGIDFGEGLEDLGAGGPDLAVGSDGGGQGGCGETQNCYTVYAHAGKVLYHVDLTNKALVTVGPFKAPMVPSGNKMIEDTMTDLAVAPDDTIWVISKTNLYTADAADGHVTLVGPVGICGLDNVALTFIPDGTLYAADHMGAFCRIDTSVKPPKVTLVGTLGGGLAISGDLVAVSDGTMYGTAYMPGSATSAKNNVLVKLDPATGVATTIIGATGFPNLYGVAFENDQVFGFTGDGSGKVVTIDPKTGKGTLYNTFRDPVTHAGINFSGAGVNSKVPAPPIG